MRKSDMPEVYQTKLNEINEQAKKSRQGVQRIATRFPLLPHLMEIWKGTYGCNAYLTVSYGGSFNITVRELTTFRDSKLIDLLASVEEYFGVEFKMTDRAQYSCKQFTAAVEWGPYNSFDISVDAYLSADSSRCQRVQTGTKVETVETPIYELHCPESEA